MRAWLLSASVLLVMLIVFPAVADIPPGPHPRHDPFAPDVKVLPKSMTVPLTIRPGRTTRTTTLSLPAGTGNRSHTELVPADGGQPGLPAGHTIVAGLALSAALVLGGLWLARKRSHRALAGIACVFAAVVVVGLSCGPGHNEVIRTDDKGKLPELDPPTMQADGSLAGRCRLERGSGDEVVLSINREALTELARRPAKEDAP